jgi:hypothetical protein
MLKANRHELKILQLNPGVSARHKLGEKTPGGRSNVDASPVNINTGYSGNKRNSANPSPGPFEILQSGKQLIKVWGER